MNKKIIAIDSWTKGIRILSPIARSLDSCGIDFKLVHFGSFGHEKGRPKKEVIEGVETNDISIFKKSTISEILDKEKPDGILLLSVESLLLQAVICLAKHQEIPVFHCYHGFVTVQAPLRPRSQDNFAGKVSKAIERICNGKQAFKNLGEYTRSLIITSKPKGYLFLAIFSLLKKSFGFHSDAALVDIKSDVGFVFTKSDAMHMKEKYKIDESRIFVVGNPDLDLFGIRESDIGVSVRNSAKKMQGASVMYIATSIVSEGLASGTSRDYLNFFLQLNKKIQKLGGSLSIKLKPSAPTFSEDEFGFLRKKGIQFVSRESFLDDLKVAKCVICEATSLAVVPCLLGHEVWLMNCGPFVGWSYGEVLMKYPRIRDLNSVDFFAENLLETKSPKPSTHDKLREWWSENSGPLPSSNFGSRISAKISDFLA